MSSRLGEGEPSCVSSGGFLRLLGRILAASARGSLSQGSQLLTADFFFLACSSKIWKWVEEGWNL